MDIGNILKSMRISSGLTVKDVSKITKTKEYSIHSVEYGRHNPNLEVFKRLLKCYGYDITLTHIQGGKTDLKL